MGDVPRFTRRDLLAGTAAAGAGVLLGPAVARAERGRGAAAIGSGDRVFRYEVGRLRRGTSAPITPGRAFCLVAVECSAPTDAGLELRTRRAGGDWGRWGAASSAGHDGDGVPATRLGERRVGEPMWTGRASELQLRSRDAVAGVSLVLVTAESAASAEAAESAESPESPESAVDPADPSGQSSPSGRAGELAGDALPLATPTLHAGPGQPPIIARRVWAGTNHPPVHGPFYGQIELGVVHHTENPNGYSRAEVPAMLRAIYAFHVHGRGWFDIGYNFVVDHFGRIWEARQGGIDLPISGAQAGDWNPISFGVSMLGTYTDVTPAPVALAAVEHLLAWKMALNGLPVRGSVPEVVSAGGVAWTQFRVGQHVRFPRIAGHRDVDATDCPGDALYRHLPAMRPRIAELAGPRVALTLTAEVGELITTGAQLTLSGRLAGAGIEPGPGLAGAAGPGLAGEPIVIEAVVGRFGETRQIATATTDGDGRFTATLAPRSSLLLRALHAAAPAAVSPLIAVAGVDAPGSRLISDVR